MTATTATSVGGFTILPLRYSSSATHNIYVRAHAGSRPKNVPEGRALFLVNVPPDATEHELSTLFSSYGTVEKVVFSSSVVSHDELEGDDDDEDVQDDAADDESESSSEDEHPRKKRKLDKGAKDKKKKPTAPPRVEPLLASSSLRTLRASGSSAHLVFLDPSSLQRALSSLPPPKPPAWPPKTAKPEPSGLSYYAARHAALRPPLSTAALRPPLSTVLTHAESAIVAYDWKLEKQKRIEKSKYKKGEEIVDEDGFTLVVRGGAYGQSVGGGVGVASKRFELAHNKEDEQAAQKKKKKKEKEGFYAFQVREKNLKEHAELRRKFEEDKKKVEEMQKKRAFVPY